MALGPVASIVASAGIAGTIAIGALATWNGGSELTGAKNLIVQQADALGIYHTNEGKLLNQVSTLKSQIATLEANGSTDQTQIASLQAQLKTANDQLTAAQNNGMTLANAVDTQNAAINQANADADSLNTTVQANSTVTTSDQTSVDAALQPADPAPTPSPSPTPALEVDYVSATMPIPLVSESGQGVVKLDKSTDGTNLVLYNVSDSQNYTYSTDGTNYTTISTSMSSPTVLGKYGTLTNQELWIKNASGTITTVYLVAK